MKYFNKVYFLLTSLLFLTELFIARYLNTGFIRAYGGDFLVVIFLYCAAKSFINSRVLITAICVLVFAYATEISQYFHLINMIGLQNSRIAKLILGTTFSMTDILMYTIGIFFVIVIEILIRRK